jgi:hypothetical protein
MPSLRFLILVALWALSAGPANANFVSEPTYQDKTARAALVVIGTVTAIDPGGRGGEGPNATLSVLQRLKGDSASTITVGTYSRISEMNVRCCEVGATYLMFLAPTVDNGQLQSVWGAYGMVRIGGPPSRIRVGGN